MKQWRIQNTALRGTPVTQPKIFSFPKAECGDNAEQSSWTEGYARRHKNSVFDAKNGVFGSKRAEIEELMLLIS
jgi:hypothetical protein